MQNQIYFFLPFHSSFIFIFTTIPNPTKWKFLHSKFLPLGQLLFASCRRACGMIFCFLSFPFFMFLLFDPISMSKYLLLSPPFISLSCLFFILTPELSFVTNKGFNSETRNAATFSYVICLLLLVYSFFSVLLHSMSSRNRCLFTHFLSLSEIEDFARRFSNIRHFLQQ